jgi:hypothetical protein
MYNNIARFNLIDTKYRQMAFQSLSDGTPISLNQQSFRNPDQTKVSGDRQWETIHEMCCLAAKYKIFMSQNYSCAWEL